jgi:SHS2 domain-containing protein
MGKQGFEEIEHTADWSIRVNGMDLNALFRNAALGMYSLLQLEFKPADEEHRTLQFSAIDLETLLVTWLEELLYWIESERIGAREFDLEIKDTTLHASVEAAPIKPIKKDIKAVTYNELMIEQNMDKEFHTTIVFDV